MNLPITIDMKDAVFQRYEIEISQNSLRPIDDNWHNEVINAFYQPTKFKASRFSQFPLSTVLNYLRKTHQLYLNRKLGEIQMELNKLSFKEDYEQYWLPILSQLFVQFSQQLTNHIQDEENNLFPYIDSLLDAEESGAVQFNIKQKIELVSYLLDHDDFAEESLKFVINLLEDKHSYFSDQLALRVLLSRLKVLETDLLVHAQIEDEVLIPKAMQLEIDVLNDADIDVA